MPAAVFAPCRFRSGRQPHWLDGALAPEQKSKPAACTPGCKDKRGPSWFLPGEQGVFQWVEERLVTPQQAVILVVGGSWVQRQHRSGWSLESSSNSTTHSTASLQLQARGGSLKSTLSSAQSSPVSPSLLSRLLRLIIHFQSPLLRR